MEYIQNNLPYLTSLYTTYTPYLRPLYRTLALLQSTFYTTVYPALYPVYILSSKALHTLLSSPSSSRSSTSSSTNDTISTLLPLLILSLILLITLRVLNYLRRTLAALIALAIRIVFWSCVAAFAWYVYERGWDRAVEDLGWIWGVLEGLESKGRERGGRKAAAKERGWERRVRDTGGRGRGRGY